jgi:hypothetical protein
MRSQGSKRRQSSMIPSIFDIVLPVVVLVALILLLVSI